MGSIFSLGLDDHTFPTSAQGRRAVGIFESAKIEKDEPATPKEDPLTKFNRQQNRSSAMEAVLAWLDDTDYKYDAFDECLMVIGDVDDSVEDDESEDAYYNALWNEAGDAFVSLGANAKDVQDFIDGPGEKADAAGARIVNEIKAKLAGNKADDAAIIAAFALGQDAILESVPYYPQLNGILESARNGIFEAAYKKEIHWSHGKKIKKNVRQSGKVKLSPKQKAAVRKMLKKSHTAQADRQREKTMKRAGY